MITGGASGIGESIVRLFVNHGAKVVIADILDELGEVLSHQLGSPETSTFLHCDVACESDVRRAVDTCIRNYGRLDIMVNNAAVVDKESQANIFENDTAEFERVVRVNLTGSFLGTKHAARVMGLGGSIINLGSVSSSVGGIASHAYTSSKHGVIGLTKNVAAELGQRGIRVNCVSPYFILTPLTKKFFNVDENAEGFKVYSNLEGVTLGCEDVASAVLFLAGDESKYISGHNLAVDGGFTAINPAFGTFARSV